MFTEQQLADFVCSLQVGGIAPCVSRIVRLMLQAGVG